MRTIEKDIDGRHFTAAEHDGHGTIKYGLAEAGEMDLWFRWSVDADRWVWLRDGIGTTVDREALVTAEVAADWEREGWIPAEAWEMLSALKSA